MWATGTASHRGFSLIELLAVIVIMGVISGIALLSVDLASGQVRVREEGQRFTALMRLLCEEAILQQREFGVFVEEYGYAFSVWEGNAWAAHPAPVFRPRQVPDGLELSLSVGGERAEFDGSLHPQLVCFSSGELTPFTLEMNGPGDIAVAVTGGALGRIELADQP